MQAALKITNQDQLRRTVEALTETGRLIQKELAYKPELRKVDYLDSLCAHSTKLLQMINAYNEAA